MTDVTQNFSRFFIILHNPHPTGSAMTGAAGFVASWSTPMLDIFFVFLNKLGTKTLCS